MAAWCGACTTKWELSRSLNITPWIKFGQENEIHIVRGSPGKGAVKRARLEFFR